MELGITARTASSGAETARAPRAGRAGSSVPLLDFTLAGERFALRASEVREVVRAVAVASLPSAPPIVEGVINARGTVVPVLDVRSRFDLTAEPLHPDQHFVIARAGERLVAIRVGRAGAVLEVPESAIESAARSTPGVRHVAGVAKLPDGLLVIHDLAGFLRLDEAERLEAALAEQAPAQEPR